MSRVSYPSNENSENFFFRKVFKKKFFSNFLKFSFQDFYYLDKKPLTWGCLYNLWEVPIGRIWKNICGNVIFGVPEIPLLLGVLGAWMTFKKAEMAKTLKNGLIMIERNFLNYNWSHFVILSGLTLHQFQKKLLLSQIISRTNVFHDHFTYLNQIYRSIIALDYSAASS